ncbi:hypothetical protein [Streptomyces sp. NPDC090083]|uniref:hypothetical protein n=1 Tax=Streptomyces sp. NPDC090083 TaxID=3365941 RepID=UPI003830DE78
MLADQQVVIGIDIEPELMFLISNDSNNRLQVESPSDDRSVADSAIITASGGTLACHAGSTPTKPLPHPAVTDSPLARYLQAVASRGEEALAEPFDPVLGRKMIEAAIDPADPVRTLLLFQNVLAASRGSISYPFAADPVNAGPDRDDIEDADAQLVKPRALQMVNRVFIVHNGTEGAMSLHNADAWKVTPASQSKRRESGSAGVRRDPIALDLLRHHGWDRTLRQTTSPFP